MTNTKLKEALSTIGKYILVWMEAFMLYDFLRNHGAPSAINDIEESSLFFRKLLLIKIMVSVFAGLLYGISELVFNSTHMTRWPYWKIIIFKTGFYFTSFVVLMFLITNSVDLITIVDINTPAIMDLVIRPFYRTFFVYFFLVVVLLNIIKIVNQKFGPGVFYNMLIGKYHQPKVERRMFMFLDLKASTTIAEKIGHLKYSALIQDCFFDLNEVIVRHDAEVYQFVGDEVVLSWPLKTNDPIQKSFDLYFDYAQLLVSKKEQYLRNYQVQPEFKAGVHLGEATVTEVGIIKKEIAYHGDVLNTAARIQGCCNTLNAPLLASQTLVQAVQPSKKFSFNPKSDVALKGKLGTTFLYEIVKN